MLAPRNRRNTHHGYGEIKISRYLALYLAQVGWVLLGVHLWAVAFWPSSCTPQDLLKVVTCSIHLPELGTWREAALFVWLWSTPILIALEVSRRMTRSKD